MKKILFLDIDGVLAGYDWFRHRADDADFLDPDLVQKLNRLDCEVVISSSWGYDAGKTEKRLRDKGLTLPITGYTEHHEMGCDWIVRGNCIKKWLNDNMEYRDCQYAILDDDCDMLLGQKCHFVRVDPETGVTDADIDTVKAILASDIL